jgi:hypothetical protein
MPPQGEPAFARALTPCYTITLSVAAKAAGQGEVR